ncbi:MAG: glycosyltransferase family 39 protein [Acidobacteriota bacterium]
MLLSSLAVLQVVVSATGAWALGRWCSRSRWRFPHVALQVAADSCLGLLVVSYTCFALALVGMAQAASFWILFLLLALLAALGLRRLPLPRIGSVAQQLRGHGGVHWLLLAAAVAYALWILAAALLPPTAIDELTYHLQVPGRILDSGGTLLFADNVRAYFPQFGEMLFLYGLAIGGELAAKLWHALFGLLLAGALYGFCRRYVSRGLALLAAALLLSVPSVMVISSWAYVDLHFALFGFLALAALLEFLDDGDRRWAVMAGIMAGGAWATKYTGLQLLLMLLLVALVEQLRGRDHRLPAAALLMAAVAFLVFLPYPLRNWLVTGWPLYPFDLGFFQLHAAMNWDAKRSQLLLAWLSNFGAAAQRASVDVLLAPVLVFLKARFNDIGAYDGVVGPAFLLVPLLLARRPRPRNVRRAILFSLLFLFYWTLTTRQVRFLIAILPVLSFLLVFGLSSWRSRLATGLVVILVIANLVVGVRQVLETDPWPYWRGRESRDQYLTRRVSGYPLYQQANRLLGPGQRVFLVNMRNFGYLLKCDWRADFIFQQYTLGEALRSASSASEVARFFAGRGATHLMIDEALTLTPQALDAHQRSLMKAFLRQYGSLIARNPRQPGQSLWRLRGPLGPAQK